MSFPMYASLSDVGTGTRGGGGAIFGNSVNPNPNRRCRFCPPFKGQIISKCLFGIVISTKKQKENLTLLHDTASRIIFVRFLGEVKTSKRHFEIN